MKTNYLGFFLADEHVAVIGHPRSHINMIRKGSTGKTTNKDKDSGSSSGGASAVGAEAAARLADPRGELTPPLAGHGIAPTGMESFRFIDKIMRHLSWRNY